MPARGKWRWACATTWSYGTLPDGSKLSQVHLQFTLLNGKLDVPLLQASALGGTILAHAQLDAAHAPDAALSLHVDAKNLDEALAVAQELHETMTGGAIEVRPVREALFHGA